MSNKKPKKVIKPKTIEVKKPKHVFAKAFPTAGKDYQIGDVCDIENEKVLEYLLTNKIIK